MTAYRIAAHVHSNWSYDGTWELAAIATAFRRRGYAGLLMVEHDRGFSAERWRAYQAACAAAGDGILLVPGIEYEDAQNVVHTAVWGDAASFLGESRPTLDVLRAAASEGSIAIFAHPARRLAIGEFSPDWVPHLAGVEIWNRKYDGLAPNQASLRLAAANQLPGLVSLDFHTRKQMFPLGLTVDVPGLLTAPALIEAIRRGAFKSELAGMPAMTVASGVPGGMASMLEATRRQAAHRYRALRGLGQSAQPGRAR